MYLAYAFARSGHDIVLHGRDEKKLKALQEEILKKEKVQCTIVVADLGNVEELGAIRTALTAENVDILINNAAVNPELDRGSAMTDAKEIDAVMKVNAASPIALCYAAFEHFKTVGGGIIMNINSVAGLRGSSHETLYAASKFGLRGFSESVKEDWLKEGVRMIDVYPGALGTGMSAKRADVQKLIDPEEFAEFLVELCRTNSFFIKELNVRRTAL